MSQRRYRVTGNFPILGKANSHQVVIVEGSSWGVALGKAAREFKQNPLFKRRRIINLSLMVEQIGEGRVERTIEGQTEPDHLVVQGEMLLEVGGEPDPIAEDAEEVISLDSIPAEIPAQSEEGLIYDPNADFEEVDRQAERLILEGPRE